MEEWKWNRQGIQFAAALLVLEEQKKRDLSIKSILEAMRHEPQDYDSALLVSMQTGSRVAIGMFWSGCLQGHMNASSSSFEPCMIQLKGYKYQKVCRICIAF